MKIQCNCGAKYAFDIKPEMAQYPVTFVCAECGLDSSAMVNSLIVQELRAAGSVPAPPPPRAIAPGAPMAVRVVAPASPAAPADAVPARGCAKHPHQQPVDTCRVCGKPICPSCMAVFGYVCSPHCRAKATSMGLNVPVFLGQKSVMEARRWRIIGWSAGLAAGFLALVLGGWFWYAWFGCVPKPVLSVRFPERAYSGHSVFAGKQNDQVVFLHADTLARYELSSKKKVWSCELLDRKRIAEEVQRDLKEIAEHNSKLRDNGFTQLPRTLTPEELQKEKEQEAAAMLRLSVHGQNIWVFSPETVTRYDWETGKRGKDLSVDGSEVVLRGDDAFIVDPFSESPKITRLNLLTAETHVSDLPTGLGDGESANRSGTRGGSPKAGSVPTGNNESRSFDPDKLAQQVQALPIEAKLALPALLAARMNQERLVAELDDVPQIQPNGSQREQAHAAPRPVFVPTRDGVVGMSVELLESRIVERVAMKPAPTTSALDGSTKAFQSLDVANELLNEMSRNRGGDKVREDFSRYRVTLSSLGTKDSWTGEVVGPPRIIPLESVNVLVSSKSVLILDKSQKKLWQSALGFEVPQSEGYFDPDDKDPNANIGPCIERKDSLYVFDQGVLTAFDLKTGNARWRLPTVGITGVYFDEHDMLYVNTTTASHEKIKYSRQIDVTQVPGAMILKVEPKSGKILWRTGDAGWVSHIAGRYIFSVSSYTVSEEQEAMVGTSFETGFEQRAYLRIRRINPKNGKIVWEHFEQRAPLDLEFEKNFIRLVFRKEVVILKFTSL